MTPPERIIVTGLGVLSPTGLGHADFWKAALACDTSRLAGARQVTLASSFEPAAHIPAHLLPQTARVTQMTLAGTDWALADAELELSDVPAEGRSTVFANAFGGTDYVGQELRKLWTLGPGHVKPYLSYAWFYAANSSQASIRHDAHGPAWTLVSGQAGGLDAVAQASRHLRRGGRVAMTGGFDSFLDPIGREVASGYLAAADARCPDASSVVGEGGAALVLETDTAHPRPSAAYGQIKGYGTSFDPVAPRPGDSGLERAVRAALADARVDPADIDVVFAGGSGPGLDDVETAAVTEVFDGRAVPVTSPKTLTGEMGAGGAALDVAAALLSLHHQVIPPTARPEGVRRPPGVDMVYDRPRETRLGNALVLARGHGGHNSALVVGALN
ncbi:ketosynthase chain-length factor [Actinomadura luteofluorescens]|uniref:beta-ketoacyl synthase N-terminal-like domain-containing protein n=1 Tax=Actinomadura luteofluorescens TaxID=46163 RepID=UPI002164EA4E|nr:beta-ketoacyl synthase N-terminal-like domain-containing protein [Actinomadura glauciflava]MCR3743503.1 act minimal PKS chain-length factor (CLF/KS beta) [Actinomadura glauciflava]